MLGMFIFIVQTTVKPKIGHLGPGVIVLRSQDLILTHYGKDETYASTKI